jgi:dTDP-4-dehydrorhamnose 3,5-epimerase
MKFEEKKIRGVYEITLCPNEDERGFFMRVYDKKIFREMGIDAEWVQRSQSFNKSKGTVRGMHFQYPPDTECKLLRAVTGEAFLAIIDLRKGSETFGKWVSMILSEEKKNIAFVPRGCANGICTLTDNCNLLYDMSNYFNPDNQDVIKWNDSEIGIKWPVKNPSVISERDSKGKSLAWFKKNHGGIKL